MRAFSANIHGGNEVRVKHHSEGKHRWLEVTVRDRNEMIGSIVIHDVDNLSVTEPSILLPIADSNVSTFSYSHMTKDH